MKIQLSIILSILICLLFCFNLFGNSLNNNNPFLTEFIKAETLKTKDPEFLYLFYFNLEKFKGLIKLSDNIYSLKDKPSLQNEFLEYINKSEFGKVFLDFYNKKLDNNNIIHQVYFVLRKNNVESWSTVLKTSNKLTAFSDFYLAKSIIFLDGTESTLDIYKRLIHEMSITVDWYRIDPSEALKFYKLNHEFKNNNILLDYIFSIYRSLLVENKIFNEISKNEPFRITPIPNINLNDTCTNNFIFLFKTIQPLLTYFSIYDFNGNLTSQIDKNFEYVTNNEKFENFCYKNSNINLIFKNHFYPSNKFLIQGPRPRIWGGSDGGD